jgi:hypothetical protein
LSHTSQTHCGLIHYGRHLLGVGCHLCHLLLLQLGAATQFKTRQHIHRHTINGLLAGVLLVLHQCLSRHEAQVFAHLFE